MWVEITHPFPNFNGRGGGGGGGGGGALVISCAVCNVKL